MAETAASQHRDSVLDRSIDLTHVSWWTVFAAVIFVAGVSARFIGLDWVALSHDEARRSYLALSFYDGRPLAGMSLPDTAPVMLLGQAFSYVLFGVTDVTARLLPLLAGVGIVMLALMLRPFVGRTAVMGMGVAAAFSPSLLYASRIANPEILVAFFGLLFLVSLVYTGRTVDMGGSGRGWSAAVGIALAGMLASGPSSI